MASETASAGKKQKSALFVCLGNICRSPIAEAVFLDLLKKKNVQNEWLVDSAGTGDWHVGCAPDKRARQTLKKHDVEYNNKARLLRRDDYEKFQFIFGMDDNNITDIKQLAPKNSSAKIEMLGDYDPENERIIRDPYYDNGSEGFEHVYEQCVRCCAAFLDKNT